jgi:hypothetical protein
MILDREMIVPIAPYDVEIFLNFLEDLARSHRESDPILEPSTVPTGNFWHFRARLHRERTPKIGYFPCRVST